MSAKARVREAFSRACQDYDSVANLQQHMGRILVEQIGTLPLEGRLLDLGCGTGFVLDELNAPAALKLVGLDISLAMLRLARSKLSDKQAAYVCADAENLPLLDNSCDIVVSNFALQWCRDLNRVFAELQRVLKEGGRLHFTTFGSGTLEELRQAWREVDDYQHVNDFISRSNLQTLLNRYGFDEVQIIESPWVMEYVSINSLLTELKQWGAQTVLTGHNKGLTTRAAVNKMRSAYLAQSRLGEIRATYQVLFVSAKL